MKSLAVFALLFFAVGSSHYVRFHHNHQIASLAAATPAGDTISGINGI